MEISGLWHTRALVEISEIYRDISEIYQDISGYIEDISEIYLNDQI